ncbi:hypothetical protein [Streptomyces sp. NPDC014764]|uniref:hypothetical protein n=1 Tax=Streptomyces sp. NPDC014764 TaxID=3364907 RepID=UPI0036FF9D1F
MGVLTLAAALIATGRLPGGTDDGGDRLAEQAADARWVEGVTPEWMSEQMRLDIPVTARSPLAAYEVTSRFDTGLLTFTLTRAEAEAYLKEHPPEGDWLEPASAQTDVTPHDFAHLGLPEPESLKEGMRYGFVCPGVAEAAVDPHAPGVDTSDESCVGLYAHEYTPARTRIYLRDHYEPGISPLPTPPEST